MALLPQEPGLRPRPHHARPGAGRRRRRVLHRQTSSGARRTAGALLASLGLGHASAAFPHTLSGGMAQRVAFAAATIGGAPVLIADEPSKGLDRACPRRTGGTPRTARRRRRHPADHHPRSGPRPRTRRRRAGDEGRPHRGTGSRAASAHGARASLHPPAAWQPNPRTGTTRGRDAGAPQRRRRPAHLRRRAGQSLRRPATLLGPVRHHRRRANGSP